MITHAKTKLSIALLASVIGFAGQMHGMQRPTNEDRLMLNQRDKRVFILDKEKIITGYFDGVTEIDLGKGPLNGMSIMAVQPYREFASDAVERLSKLFAAVDRDKLVGVHVHSSYLGKMVTKITPIANDAGSCYVVKFLFVSRMELDASQQSLNRGLEALARKSLDGMNIVTDSE